MANNTDRVQIQIDIETEQGIRQVAKLQQELAANKAELKELTALGEGYSKTLEKLGRKHLNAQTQEWKDAIKVYNDNDRAIKNLQKSELALTMQIERKVKELGLANLTNKELNRYYNQQKQALDTVKRGTEEYTIALQNLRNVQSEREIRKVDIKGTESFFSQLKSQGPAALIGGLAGGFVGVLTSMLSSIGSFVTGAIAKFGQLSDTLADMQKATGMTAKETKQLNAELSNIDTRTTKKELQDIVVVAGQLGIANDQIKDFTKDTDKLVVSLKDEFKGGAEEITNVFGGLRNVFADIKTKNVGEDMVHLGNAVNVLAASGRATGPVVADMANRIGAAGTVYGLTAGQTLGLAASFQELEIKSERGGTAVVRILQEISSAPAKYAKIARMGAKEFANLVNTDISKALLLVSKGFASSKGKATEFAAKLEDVNISSAEISEVLAKVGQNTDLITEKTNLATEALKSSNSIRDEFNIKNQNDAAQMEKAGKVWDSWIAKLGAFLSFFASPVIALLAKMGEKSEDLSEKYKIQKENTDNLVTSSAPLLKRYNELLPQINGNAKAQRELNKVISEIGKLVPSAVTEFDKYGNALAINIGLVNEFIDKQKKASDSAKWSLISEKNTKNNALEGEARQIRLDLKGGTISSSTNQGMGQYIREVRRLTDEEIRERTARLEAIQKELALNRQRVKELKTTQTVTNTENKDKPTGTVLGETKEEKAEREKAEKKRIERLKRDQEFGRKEVELAAQIAFERDQALASEEDKAVQARERAAEDKLTKIRQQFTDENGLIKSYGQLNLREQNLIAAEEKELEISLQNDVLKIRKEFQLKREEQIREQATRSIEIAQSARIQALEKNVTAAERSGDDFAVFNAKNSLIIAKETASTSQLDQKYVTDQLKLKNNNKALLALEKNYAAELKLIQVKSQEERDVLLEIFSKSELDKKVKNNLEKLRLEASNADQQGKNPLEAKKAVLNAEMALELSQVGLSEQAKANIREKYRQQNVQMEREAHQKIAEQAAQTFNQVFSTFLDFQKSALDNEQADSDANFQKKIDNLEAQKDRGILTEKEYSDKKADFEKQHDKKSREIKKKQFELDKAANIANVIMATALAIMKAGANLPLQILEGVMGAAQLVKIATTKAPAYYEGGPTHQDSGSGIDGRGGRWAVVHPNEFIANARATASPYFPNVLRVLQALNAGRTPEAYETGGFVQGFTTGTSVPAGGEMNGMIQAFTNALVNVDNSLKSLNSQLNSGIKAQAVFGYETVDDITTAQKDIQTIKNDAAAA